MTNEPHTPPYSGHTRTLLLVDDEENIIAALRRLLRRDGYQILTASSGPEGLALLSSHQVDVIVSDQRMPGMTGVEFLRQAKATHPDSVRIVLSGYTELQSITDAINEGAIYKFLTKPWEDEQLRANIEEAFRYKELSDENQFLGKQLADANVELARSNEQLRDLLSEKQRQLQRDQDALSAVQEVLQCMPIPVIGLDSEGLVVCVNREADTLLGQEGSIIGNFSNEVLPESLQAFLNKPIDEVHPWTMANTEWSVITRDIGKSSGSIRGRLLILLPREGGTS
jgi:CheY-like chemotaxis protein